MVNGKWIYVYCLVYYRIFICCFLRVLKENVERKSLSISKGVSKFWNCFINVFWKFFWLFVFEFDFFVKKKCY